MSKFFIIYLLLDHLFFFDPCPCLTNKVICLLVLFIISENLLFPTFI